MANTKEIRVPDIGDFDSVELIDVLVAVGDEINPEDPLVALESDKAMMEVPAPFAGKISEIKVKAGDSVSKGDLLMIAEVGDAGDSEQGEKDESSEESGDKDSGTSDESDEPVEDAADANGAPDKAAQSGPANDEPQQSDSAESESEKPVDNEKFRKAHASPSVRRFARELGVDLSLVNGSGQKSRILKDDVQNFVKSALAGAGSAASAGTALPQQPDIDYSKWGEVEVKPLNKLRRMAGSNLHKAWLTVPHVTQFDEADITELESFRKANGEAATTKGFKLTPVAFMLKACARALQEFPDFNSSLSADGHSLVHKKYIHIGVAVDTPDGLLVPVIQNCDNKSVLQLAEELFEISGRARERKLKPTEMQGACFSISSLGGIGGTAFTPIVNMPEVAILGLSKSQTKPIWNGEEFEPRLMLPLSLSYDHRVIDGVAAARFTTYLSGLLGDFRKVVL